MEERLTEISNKIDKLSEHERKFVLWYTLKQFKEEHEKTKDWNELNTRQDYAEFFLKRQMMKNCEEMINLLDFELWR